MTTSEDAVRELSTLLADAAEARRDGRPIEVDVDAVRRLIVDLGDDPGAEGAAALCAALAGELRARRATLPPLDAFPPGVAALLQAVDGAFAPGDDGQIDFEVVAEKLNRAVGDAMGKSLRQAREQALRDRIRRDVSASVARSMRAHGLTPAADMNADDADEDGA
ncbi:hypothetical protein [Sorangium sp. So ce861]|uniref:hypothetical protein n=1 Tax=Sorangium sp. So ce861 TaxID=3133323 RepID=UPI003F6117AE